MTRTQREEYVEEVTVRINVNHYNFMRDRQVDDEDSGSDLSDFEDDTDNLEYINNDVIDEL